jgi:single-stranded-DNA-specific exonuclease
VLARYGLVRAKHSPFLGLRALVDASGLAGESIGEMEVGFRLGPRLNAAGRMGHAKEAVELFTTADLVRATEIATKLSAQNDARRSVEKAIFEQACEMAERAGMTGPDRRAIILAHDEWHAGVVGIVCSRLVERYHRPVILLCRKEGHCHGSGRSIDGFNLHAGLFHCSEYLDKYGGHDMAAGLHLREENLAPFTECFTEYASAAIAPEQLTSQVTVDCEAVPEEITPETVAQLEAMGPFGAGNPQPRVLVRGLTIAGKGYLGAQAKHLSVQLRAPATQPVGARGLPTGVVPRVWRAVAWGWGEHADDLPIGARADAVLKPRISTFTGTPTVEPEVCDLAVWPAGA